MNWKEFQRKWMWSNWGTSPAYSWRNWRKPRKTIIKVASVLAEMWHDRYYTSLFNCVLKSGGGDADDNSSSYKNRLIIYPWDKSGMGLGNILYSWKSKMTKKVLLHKYIELAIIFQWQNPYKNLCRLRGLYFTAIVSWIFSDEVVLPRKFQSFNTLS
jgi:hypothetical protein